MPLHGPIGDILSANSTMLSRKVGDDYEIKKNEDRDGRKRIHKEQ